MGLNARAWMGLACLAAAMALVLFGAAGTVRYWQGWDYLAVFLGASLLITLDLMKRDPALLARRLRGGPTSEVERPQRIAMLFASIGFTALLVVPALDHRYRWSAVPPGVVFAGDALTALGFYAVYRVYRENTFASATIGVAQDQRVVSTGPYAVVRHPMYAGSLIYLLGTPFALGSYWGVLVLAATMPFLLWRLVEEERFLARNLPGYTAYCARVRWRLIPGIY